MTDNNGASTDVATQSKTQRAVGKLPPEMQAMVELRRANNIIAAQISETNWGKGMDLETRRSISEWGRRHEIDVTTEINVLGGNVYINSNFYLGRLAKMVEHGLVEYAIADHVEVDPRLAEFPDETKRRLLERIRFQLPETAKSSVVARIKLKSVPVEFTAAKWCGNRGQNQYGKPKDPVGEEFPVETSETRAFRRCLKLLVSHIPDEVRRIQMAEEDAELSLTTVLERSHAQQEVEGTLRHRQLSPAPVADVMESYGKEEKRESVAATAAATDDEDDFIDDRDLVDR
jgi:hypothetical protein